MSLCEDPSPLLLLPPILRVSLELEMILVTF
jgi:hypothetical protein